VFELTVGRLKERDERGKGAARLGSVAMAFLNAIARNFFCGQLRRPHRTRSHARPPPPASSHGA